MRAADFSDTLAGHKNAKNGAGPYGGVFEEVIQAGAETLFT
jgi:hypothetical protein